MCAKFENDISHVFWATECIYRHRKKHLFIRQAVVGNVRLQLATIIPIILRIGDILMITFVHWTHDGQNLLKLSSKYKPKYLRKYIWNRCLDFVDTFNPAHIFNISNHLPCISLFSERARLANGSRMDVYSPSPNRPRTTDPDRFRVHNYVREAKRGDFTIHPEWPPRLQHHRLNGLSSFSAPVARVTKPCWR